MKVPKRICSEKIFEKAVLEREGDFKYFKLIIVLDLQDRIKALREEVDSE